MNSNSIYDWSLLIFLVFSLEIEPHIRDIQTERQKADIYASKAGMSLSKANMDTDIYGDTKFSDQIYHDFIPDNDEDYDEVIVNDVCFSFT